MGPKTICLASLCCLIFVKCNGEGSCDGMSDVAYEYMVRGIVTLPRAKPEADKTLFSIKEGGGLDAEMDVTTGLTIMTTPDVAAISITEEITVTTTEDTTATTMDYATVMTTDETIIMTTDTAMDMEERNVSISAHVALTLTSNATTLTVLSLQMSTPSGIVLENPPGLGKPVIFYYEDLPALENLLTEDDETFLSVAIKKSIINMLPKKIHIDELSYSQLKDMLDLLNEGKENIILSEEYKDLSLILGNTGCGKSTFVQWIADTNNVLKGVEIPGGDFIIEDQQGKISNETINSKTIFPDFIVDPIREIAYYDMPGFSDTRSSVIEIAASYFTTSVIEHARRVKIIFLINYSSVRKGIDRSDFLLFLKHATELINDIDKYVHSIVLVVTKVEYKLRKGRLVDDKEIKEGIADFLKEVKQVIKSKLSENLESMPPKQQIFYNKAIKLIDIFLIKDEGYYSRIGLFRRPDDSGLLSEMDLLKIEKDDVRNIIVNDLLYTNSNLTDFGRTISEKSKNDVNKLMEVVEKRMLSNICQLSSIIQLNLQEELDNLTETISAINIIDPIETVSKIYHVNERLNYMRSKIHTLQILTDAIKREYNLENVPELIVQQINNMNFNISDKLSSDIGTEGKYLKFLITTLDEDYTIRLSQFAWASVLQNTFSGINSKINALEHDVDEFNKKLETKVMADLTKINVNMIDKYKLIETNTPDIHELQKTLKLKLDNLTELQNTSDFLVFLTKAFDILNLDNISYASYIPEYINKTGSNIVYLRTIFSYSLSYLHESQMWYDYLFQLIAEFSSYNNEINISRCYGLSRNITLHDENKEVKFTSLETLLKECFIDDYTENYDKVKMINLSEPRLWHLKQLLDLLFEVTHTYEDDAKMVVKGFNVKMSDFVKKSGSFHVKLLEIFALNKVFIDTDFINHDSIQLAIVAPKWHIEGKRNINLDGLDGKPHEQLKARDGLLPGEDGQDGKSGNPGRSGGVFLGIGDQFVNDKDLSISANGGNGGRGQDGGDGSWGRNGYTPNIQNPESFLERIGWWNNGNKYDCGLFTCHYKPIEPEVSCSDGGNGGKGGIWGAGGLRGVIKFVSTSSKSFMYRSTSDGEDGIAGNPGRAGRAGGSAPRVKVDWTWPRFWDMTTAKYEETPKCSDGKSPEYFNSNQDRDMMTRTPEISMKRLFEDYKSFTEENIYFRGEIKKFLDKLQSTIKL